MQSEDSRTQILQIQCKKCCKHFSLSQGCVFSRFVVQPVCGSGVHGSWGSSWGGLQMGGQWRGLGPLRFPHVPSIPGPCESFVQILCLWGWSEADEKWIPSHWPAWKCLKKNWGKTLRSPLFRIRLMTVRSSFILFKMWTQEGSPMNGWLFHPRRKEKWPRPPDPQHVSKFTAFGKNDKRTRQNLKQRLNVAFRQVLFFWSKKLEMLGSIVSRFASPRKILGENFFEHSGWYKTSRNA